MVMSNFWSKVECEVLPVSHLILVHCAQCFDDLIQTN